MKQVKVKVNEIVKDAEHPHKVKVIEVVKDVNMPETGEELWKLAFKPGSLSEQHLTQLQFLQTPHKEPNRPEWYPLFQLMTRTVLDEQVGKLGLPMNKEELKRLLIQIPIYKTKLKYQGWIVGSFCKGCHAWRDMTLRNKSDLWDWNGFHRSCRNTYDKKGKQEFSRRTIVTPVGATVIVTVPKELESQVTVKVIPSKD